MRIFPRYPHWATHLDPRCAAFFSPAPPRGGIGNTDSDH
ncbi:hypothetical protein BMA721280_M0238 [Burkholderia mallei 2002721280]|uniref:Uncharacterized protein n=1 Tax=Burkholderia mallei (strain NCTC 10229) TaxID=412022 RepID=A2RYV9_BURM9|nr:hypothetical protein BMASAVP1_0778 [Burkholderia mallei SAVP1]ABN00040.1 hypothetical protein BMA10229_1071 [Burkholderia mallei NCTC 10229]EDK52642.1 hypothetical protein BMAFMH_G0051 [Burkholderia mallei FMH]EDK61854.1 hypothetical protein BMAJHU_I0999 [Burkholderia mallei JHU]EDK83167.1 hypothetical protein BMA721280_M0238 [Burkholderia mallei 2002721280]EDP87623.1 hypothetical protein BMA10399_B1864 [Burkholderia mallei ATCC 10399]